MIIYSHLIKVFRASGNFFSIISHHFVLFRSGISQHLQGISHGFSIENPRKKPPRPQEDVQGVLRDADGSQVECGAVAI